MSTTATIAQSLQGGSTTNGWDAAYAMNLKQLNALLLQQYLQDGPTSPVMPLRLILGVGQEFWILDVILGPPEFSFQPGGATLQMELVRGSLIAFDPQKHAVLNAVRIRSKESKLTGPMALDKVKGEVNQLGKVVVDLGASAYTPSIGGVDPKGVLNTEIGAALQTFFATNETKFPLGAIAPGNVCQALSPTEFYFSTQQNPSSQDACVVLLITTNGTAGTVGPLPTYPIPDNRTAALLISARAVFGGALVSSLNASFSSLGTTFSGKQSGNTWSTVGSGGGVAFGPVGSNQPEDSLSTPPWSSDGTNLANPAGFSFPLDKFTVSVGQNSLTVSWGPSPTTTWSVWRYTPPIIRGGIGLWMPSSTQVLLPTTYQQSSNAPTVDPITDQVSFEFGEPSVNIKPQNLASGWDQFWGGTHGITVGLGQGIGSALKQAFKNFKLLSVDAFALVNLWFPAKHVVSLKEVQIPADLYLTGSLVQPIEVTPVDSVIAPGGQVQFTASGIAASDVLWETKPRSGSISATGLYTAPSFIAGAEVVVVIAVNKNDANKSGSAMVLVDKSPAASGVAVAPGNSVVTPGQSIQLSTTDAKGQPVNVNWTLSPNIGQIVSGFTDGSYTYTAPASIESATQVTASAVNSSKSSLTGVAIIQVTPSAVITVTPAQASAKPGATVVLTATATAGNTDDLCWVVYPTGAGTVKANPNSSAQATYTAPKAGHPDARVVAYLVDDEAAGVGWSDIKLTS